jgi:hypothetical protein
MFHPKHVELFAGNKILYKKCHLVGKLLKILWTCQELEGFCVLSGYKHRILMTRRREIIAFNHRIQAMRHQSVTIFTERGATVSAMVPRLLSASREVAIDDPVIQCWQDTRGYPRLKAGQITCIRYSHTGPSTRHTTGRFKTRVMDLTSQPIRSHIAANSSRGKATGQNIAYHLIAWFMPFIYCISPRRYPYFDVVVGLVWSHDPKSYADGSVCYW